MSWRNSWLWLESWCMWAAVTGLIWTCSLILVTLIGENAWLKLPDPLAHAASAALLGGLVGLTQRLVLGPATRSTGLWIAASAMGCLLGLEGMVPLLRTWPGLPGLWLGSLLGGISLGAAQYVALPRIHWRRSWLIMTVAGWVLAMMTGSLASTPPPDITVSSLAATWAIGGGIVMVVAVVSLVVLFPRPRRALPEERLIWRR